jgi:hypothetical protein
MTELQRLYAQTAPMPGESERSRCLALLEAYYRGTQYGGLHLPWDASLDDKGAPVPFRLRRPSTVVPLPRLIVDTFVRALWATGRRPIATLKGADDTDDNAALADLIKAARLYRVMREATTTALITGTGCIVWARRSGRITAQSWDPKWCTPTFAPGATDLIELELRHPYTTNTPDGRQVTKWHREVLTAEAWKVYRDVEVTSDREPQWSEDTALTAEHGLGFVPAVWFTVGDRCGVDGTGIFSDLLSLFDDANYTASQQGRCLYYNLDPQLVLSGVAEVDVAQLQKGGSTTWPLPVGATAELLESDGTYVAAAAARLDALRKWVLDAAAVVINDPEKITGAQSGSALELLSAPMLARVSDLREDVGDGALVPLLEQMLRADGAAEPSVLLHWGSLSPSTTDDARAATEAATQAVEAGILSKAGAARYVAPHVGVADVEVDQRAVEAEREEAEQQLTEAAVLETVQIPSPTFQALYRARLAARVLGSLATPEIERAIAEELKVNLSAEELIARMRPAPEPDPGDPDEAAEPEPAAGSAPEPTTDAE